MSTEVHATRGRTGKARRPVQRARAQSLQPEKPEEYLWVRHRPRHQPGCRVRLHRKDAAAALDSGLLFCPSGGVIPGSLCASGSSFIVNRVLVWMRMYRATLFFVFIGGGSAGCGMTVARRFAWIFSCCPDPGGNREDLQVA